ncbi:endonuclease [Pedobacter ginsengisoli]|uniref:Endonuclease n=1 Tax=Pedobacter ginsengisoli TaxID=363852 RepID=A0A2D1UBD6_9SPHI|nr:endonuclease/exonuclease/phosphatase family protein [Pedobacter ginsengisoli]ATP58930.1 endonuclease [Pedobacter ginsengisoli]
MRIITWNCNGAFRKKFEHLAAFDADIIIVQECENPLESKDKHYIDWAINHLWHGDTKNKGIGIFAREGIKLQRLDWPSEHMGHTVKHFLPCSVNDEFNILAVWLHQNKSPTFGYIGQFWKYLQVNKVNMMNTIVIGDFNSNVRWDQWDRWWNHSDVVRELAEIGIVSLYHKLLNEEQGKETRPTFYLHRNLEKPYHIDYCFAPASFHARLTEFTLGNYQQWISISDHMPMSLKFEVAESFHIF